MDAYWQAAKFRGRHDDLFYANAFYMKEMGVFRPAPDYACDIGYVCDTTFDFIQAERELHNLRRTILDESIPLEMPLLQNSQSRWGGGRNWDAFLLGTLRNPEACPELAEAACHDIDKNMRARCVESLGWIGKGASAYSDLIGKILLEDRDPYVWYQAAIAQGKIGNRGGSRYLCDKIDDLVPCINKIELEDRPANTEDRLDRDYHCSAFTASVSSLIDIDPATGKDYVSFLFVEASRGYGLLMHHLKKATLLKKDYSHLWLKHENIIS